MDDRQRAQVERILTFQFELARRRVAQDIGQILTSGSAKGSLRSGATLRQTCAAIEDRLGKMVDELADTIGNVARDREAFDAIRQAFDATEPWLESEVRRIAALVSGRGGGEPMPSILTAGLDLFRTGRADLKMKLDIAEFDFLATPTQTQVGAPTEAATKRNTGGKPLAEHWDAMWAAIAVKLWLGDLQPKRQADVTDAMLDWFSDKNLDVGKTAVTDRARALWQQIEAAR